MDERVNQQIASIVIDKEFRTAQRNQQSSIDNFEASIDQLECERTEKDYSWMSDIFLPEQASRMLTDASIIASQYFQTRDFVECYISDESDESLAKADAAKECINRTLNQKHLNYFQKFMRLKMVNNLGGYVYIRCWWEQETKTKTMQRPVYRQLDMDTYGNPLTDMETQVPKYGTDMESYDVDEKIIDRFNFDVLDPRNVFTDNKYCYSIQEKDWVTVRYERTLRELEDDEEKYGYINLDKLKEIKPPTETETSKESYAKNLQQEPIVKNPYVMPYDIIERHGKFCCIVTERDENDLPTKIESGLDEFGEVKDKAEYINTIISFAMSDSRKVLIRFQPSPYYDATGKSFKPIIRGLCYIHPTKDTGLGDGKYTRELGKAVNDTFNLSNDRVKLATLPTLKGRKYALEDNTTIYFEPQHTIELENPDDLVEFKISDNITGALEQIAMLTNKFDQITAIYPTTMGDMPRIASTTATAVAGAETKSTARSNYKALTIEHTLLTELYWMILQMTWTFAGEETAKKLMGEKVYNFDPNGDYVWKPVSSAIETEYSKTTKIKNLLMMLGYVSNIPHPDTIKNINYILSKVFGYMGDETTNFAKSLFNENVPMTPQGQNVQQQAVAPSNQAQIPMSGMEEMARGM